MEIMYVIPNNVPKHKFLDTFLFFYPKKYIQNYSTQSKQSINTLEEDLKFPGKMREVY